MTANRGRNPYVEGGDCRKQKHTRIGRAERLHIDALDPIAQSIDKQCERG
jgi:hypothetical protein